ELRPQPEGIARAHRRGDGADPQGVDRAATLRLARTVFPVPHGIGLAAPAISAAPADLRARHERGSRRICRAPSARDRPLLRDIRADGEIGELLSRTMRPLWLGARS